MTNKNNNNSQGLDLVSPLVEIAHELGTELVKLIIFLTKWAYRKWNKNYFEVTKIEERHLKVKKKTQNANALGYSTNHRKELALCDIDYKMHSFIVGASGFGKTNLISILQEHSLQTERPIIFIDPKGDLEAITDFKELCKKYNRTCYIFSEHQKDSIKLNHFREGSLSLVTNRIISALEWSEPFYKNVSIDALSKALKIIQDSQKEFSLASICEVLNTSFNSKETLGLRVQLDQILISDFGKLLTGGEKSKTFMDIREEQACLYIGLSTQGYGETAYSLGKIFLGELLYASYYKLTTTKNSKESMKASISVFFDEFGSLVTDRFIELQNKCRGAGIQLFMAVQSIADIDKIDPNLTQQVLESSSNFFIFKQRMEASANLFSSSIGTKLTKKYTTREDNGTDTGMTSVREVDELLVHPNIIKNLKVGQCILLRHDPTRLDLISVRSRKLEIQSQQGEQKKEESKKEDKQEGKQEGKKEKTKTTEAVQGIKETKVTIVNKAF